MKKKEFARKIVEKNNCDTDIEGAIQVILDDWEHYPKILEKQKEQHQDILNGEEVEEDEEEKKDNEKESKDRDLEKFYIPSMVITRLDIKGIPETKEEIINKLSDEDMQYIADKMRDTMMEQFWVSLKVAFDSVKDKIDDEEVEDESK